MFWPCETRTSTCRSFATISSGLYRFLAIAVLLDVKDIPQVGPLQWGWINDQCVRAEEVSPSARNRASNHRGQGQTRHVEYATRLGGERGIAAAAELGKLRGATGIGDDRRIARRAKAAELRSSTEIGGDGRVARGAELGKLGRAADVGDDGRVAGSAGIGESREAGEVGRDGRV